MIKFLILILGLGIFIFIYRNKIKKYLDREISNNIELNNIDHKAKSYIDKYSSYSSEELINFLKNNTLNSFEKKAINKILFDRQANPN